MSRTEAAAEAFDLDAELFPQFSGSAAQFTVLGTELGGGAVLGTTRTGRPARLTLLRPAPVRVVVVGQAWLASLLLVRAAALGAAAVIMTDRPAPWEQLVATVGGRPFARIVRSDAGALQSPGQTRGQPPGQISGHVPTRLEPLVVLHDGSAGGIEAAVARAPWQTSIHLVFRVSPAAGPMFDGSDLVLVPRPDDEDADAVLELLRLPPGIRPQLARMANLDVLAVTRSRAVFVTISPTSGEATLLGAP